MVREGDGGAGADVAVELTGPTSARAGDEVTYDVTARNLGPGAATGVGLRYRVPDGVEFVEASEDRQPDDDGWVRWSAEELVSGGSLDETVTVRYPVEGEYRHRAVAETRSEDPNPDNNTRTLVTTVDVQPPPDQADVSVVKEGPTQATVGDTLEYVLTTTNAGPATAQDVVVSDVLPAGWVFLSASRGGSEDGGTVTWVVRRDSDARGVPAGHGSRDGAPTQASS